MLRCSERLVLAAGGHGRRAKSLSGGDPAAVWDRRAFTLSLRLGHDPGWFHQLSPDDQAITMALHELKEV